MTLEQCVDVVFLVRGECMKRCLAEYYVIKRRVLYGVLHRGTEICESFRGNTSGVSVILND